MKYSYAKLNNGNYAVTTGKKYFTDTETEIELEAKQEAICMSIRWHQQQKEKCWKELLKISETSKHNFSVKLSGSDVFIDMSDICC